MLAPHLSHLSAPPPPQLGEQPADTDLTWAYPWPAGLRFSAALSRFVDCRGRRIADLGCGRGNLGLTALLQGGAQVVFADRSPTALAFVDAVLVANDLASRGQTACHEWGTPIPGAPFDLILGGDILYRPAFFPQLLTSIALSLAPDGYALLADPRQRLDAELPEVALVAGVTWDIMHQEPGWGTVVRAQRRI